MQISHSLFWIGNIARFMIQIYRSSQFPLLWFIEQTEGFRNKRISKNLIWNKNQFVNGRRLWIMDI